jgi:hypothetical protein
MAFACRDIGLPVHPQPETADKKDVFIVLHFRHITAAGQAERQVVCDRCRHAYVYHIQRKTALDTFPLPALIRQAEATCERRLQRRLARDVEPVECPACGWMQSHMIPELRRRFAGRLRTIGAYLAIACAVLALMCAAPGVWFKLSPPRPGGLDIDWLGMALLAAAGSAFGFVMIGFRLLLGLLRYRARGFDTGRTTDQRRLPKRAA